MLALALRQNETNKVGEDLHTQCVCLCYGHACGGWEASVKLLMTESADQNKAMRPEFDCRGGKVRVVGCCGPSQMGKDGEVCL